MEHYDVTTQRRVGGQNLSRLRSPMLSVKCGCAVCDRPTLSGVSPVFNPRLYLTPPPCFRHLGDLKESSSVSSSRLYLTPPCFRHPRTRGGFNIRDTPDHEIQLLPVQIGRSSTPKCAVFKAWVAGRFRALESLYCT